MHTAEGHGRAWENSCEGGESAALGKGTCPSSPWARHPECHLGILSSFYSSPLSMPWVFGTKYVQGLQASNVNAGHGLTSLEEGFCLWLSVSASFIQGKTICCASCCLHTEAEKTGTWPDGRSPVCLFLWAECSPALQHVCSLIALTSWSK